jgi:Dit-like phage tail protein
LTFLPPNLPAVTPFTGSLPFGISVLTAAAEGLLSPIFVKLRNIGGFVADVTIREEHSDTLVATDNPVEQGAAVTDHAFKKPAELVVEVGYSDSNPTLGFPGYVNTVYEAFLLLQSARTPFEVVTGKRLYTNMLITQLRTDTDEKTENAMFLRVEMRENIFVQTQTVTVPPAAQMTNPSNTAATTNSGANQVVPATSPNVGSFPSISP